MKRIVHAVELDLLAVLLSGSAGLPGGVAPPATRGRRLAAFVGSRRSRDVRPVIVTSA